MSRIALGSAILAGLISILIFIVTNSTTPAIITSFITSSHVTTNNITTTTTTVEQHTQPTPMSRISRAMAKHLQHAKISPLRSDGRGHSEHGWLNSYHSFPFGGASFTPGLRTQFGALRVLNEDRVKPDSGFPTHPHRDFEIFSYILSGELTHRDSMIAKSTGDGAQSDKFYRMHRGDVQFTTGGTGIAHSEFNEDHTDTVHFLQIWAFPWKKGLQPRYHTRNFSEEAKKSRFLPILSPLKAGQDATAQQEADAEPTIPDTIPIHADLVMSAGIIAPGTSFEWVAGGGAGGENKRKIFVHLPMTKKGKAAIRLNGSESSELAEGDGAFVEGLAAGDKLSVESIGEDSAEVIVLDTA